MRLYKVSIDGVIEAPQNPIKEVNAWLSSSPFEWAKRNYLVQPTSAQPHKKGPKFERDFCKRLSLWSSSGMDEDVFWRTPGSGARATTKGSDIEIGDIRLIPGKEHFGKWVLDIVVFELRDRDVSIGDIFTTPMKWFDETGRKCVKVGLQRMPVLIIKSGGCLLTFTHLALIQGVVSNYLQWGEHLGFFDFRDLFQVNPTIVRDYWSKLIS